MFKQMCLLTSLLVCLAVTIHARKLTNDVIGGQIAAKSAYPHQIIIMAQNYPFCGGTIISDQHILTAAHCVIEMNPPYNNFYILAGTSSFSEKGTVHFIKRAVKHPEYRDPMLGEDIGVITLTKPMKVNVKKHPIDLASNSTYHNAIGVVTGWGTMHPTEKSVIPIDLIELYTRVINCPYTKLLINGKNLVPAQICSKSNIGQGVCYGDSGGPLVVGKEVVGIVSSGINCADGSPQVFTSVYAYRGFIKEEMCKDLSPSDKRCQKSET